MALHFVGVRADQYGAAVRVWGKPDFTHDRATWTVMGSIPVGDTVILGKGAFSLPRKWRKVLMPHHVDVLLSVTVNDVLL